MANAIYNSFKKKIMDGSIDLDTDTIKVMLVNSGYTPDIDAHVFRSDVTNEVSDSGTYASGGSALASKTVTQDNTDNEGVFDAADISWTGFTGSPRGAVIYKDTGSAATSPLICYIDFGSDQVCVASTFPITWNTEGIVNLN